MYELVRPAAFRKPFADLEDRQHETSLRSTFSPPVVVPGVGVVACVQRYGPHGFRSEARLVIASEAGIDAPDEALRSLRARVDALSGPGVLAATGRLSVDMLLHLPVCVPCRSTPADEARRSASLQKMLERHDAVALRMREVYGLRLPHHVAVWAAFRDSLSNVERMAGDGEFSGLAGIMAWFEDGGLDRRPQNGLDPRLEGRFRRDPVELVTIACASDGNHDGLWFDDPDELPSFISSGHVTMLDEVRSSVVAVRQSQARNDLGEPDAPTPELDAFESALAWFAAANQAAVAKDGPPRFANVERERIVGDLPGPLLLPEHGDSWCDARSVQARALAYRENDEVTVARWIARAKRMLARGEPALPLVLGRELQGLCDDATREDARILLTGAYRLLGRHALAELAEFHCSQRDFPVWVHLP